MAVYTVHQPRLRKGEASVDPERLAFVRDGFSFLGFPARAVMAAVAPAVARLRAVIVAHRRCGDRAALRRSCAALRMSWSWRCSGCWSGSRRRACGAGRWRCTAGTISASWSPTISNPPSGASSSAVDRKCAARRRLAASAASLPMRMPAAATARRDRAVSRAGKASMTVAIVDYGSGNLHSAAKAFERAARESGHDQPIVVTSDPDAVRRADRVVLPGVGAFADCRRGLDAVPGHGRGAGRNRARQGPAVSRHLRRHAAHGRARPRIRGDGGAGLDRGRGRQDRPVRSDAEDSAYGLEHACARAPHPLLDGIPLGADGLHAYFVHSYNLNVGRARRPAGARRTMAGRSPPSSRATTSRARSSIRKRASGWAWR